MSLAHPPPGGDASPTLTSSVTRPRRTTKLGPIVRPIPPKTFMNGDPLTPDLATGDRIDVHSCDHDHDHEFDHDHDHHHDQDSDNGEDAHHHHHHQHDDFFEYDQVTGSDGGNKKRKVPNFYLPFGRHDNEGEDQGVSSEHPPADTTSLKITGTSPHTCTAPRSTTGKWRAMIWSRERLITRRALGFRKVQFLRRKAALITLYLDCQKALLNNPSKPPPTKSPSKPALPSTANSAPAEIQSVPPLAKKKSPLVDVDEFERLLPGLEYFGVNDWAPDSPDWRSKWDNGNGPDGDEDKQSGKKMMRLGAWKTNYERKRRAREERKPVVRGGWFPEGSFEYECPSKAGNLARERAREKVALQRLAVELRSLLTLMKTKPNERKIESAPPPAPAADSPAPAMDQTASKEGSEVSTVPGKKKSKKKKRSALANQSNPHHVDNYRPTRTLATSNPYEPYPHHAGLLFPPSMRLLSARPQSNASTPLSRPGEDEFICCFCEYDLFYGTERQRRRAIRKRREEMKRKESIKVKAKNVADGKGKLNDEEDDDDYDDEEECVDDGYGRCSCGRSLGPPNKTKERLKPPDPGDPHPDDHDHHHHHHHDHHHHPSPSPLPDSTSPVIQTHATQQSSLPQHGTPASSALHQFVTAGRTPIPTAPVSRASTPSID